MQRLTRLGSVTIGLMGVALGLAGCAKETSKTEAATAETPMLSGKMFVDAKGELSPELRGVVKRGPDYVPIAEDPEQLFDRLQGSMADRRAAAWKIVEQMISPQSFTANGVMFQIPLWHTWYEGASNSSDDPQNPQVPVNAEVYQKIDLFYSKLKACKQVAGGKCAKTYDQLAEETMNDVGGGTGSKNMVSSLTDANMKQTLAQLAGVADEHLGTGFTVFSPSFVGHLLAQSKGVMNCADKAPQFKADTPPPSATQFSPCLTEFPRSAVMVKAQWTPEDFANAAHVTDSNRMGNLFNEPRWGRGTPAPFDAKKMYTIETKEGHKWGLRSIHFSTKDTREWVWITLWWDPQPNTDFGQDRPASISGVWANYKMCVTSSFNERDPQPWQSFTASAPLLAGALKANYSALAAANTAAGGDPNHLTTWCSNPNVEVHPQNHKTNCIGCHQYAGSWNAATNDMTEFDQTYQPNDVNFPQQGRDRHRRTFLSDFTWGVALYENIPNRVRAARSRYGITATE
ncbi:hypothetical protein SAMN05518801_102413 [Novosphingobium sp. CF614]|uniref:hypothetical protein n=1 Tax=Novosphingobium sp. CF614 TaxID=1884364 RepID=UPI0008EF29AF|nr:hypothetical protein [Novosphingobium sp. CF614]SFF88179.1 hypothetical protein SAMN05518801_102413 [Novosphingobium sp. CF614]